MLDRELLIQEALLGQKNNKSLAKTFVVSKHEIREELKKIGIPHRNRCGHFSNLDKGSLSTFQEQVLVGTLLGDASLGRTRGRGNARYRIVQGMPQELYAIHKYEVFHPFSKWFRTTEAKAGNGKIYSRVEAETCTHPVFTWWFLKFYLKDGVRKVPSDIENYLTPISLAYWFMDDGGSMDFENSVRLSTNNFSLEEVLFLKEILNSRFEFSFDIKENNGPVLRYYKPGKFLQVIEPHIIPSMRYKFDKLCEKNLPRDH